ncbi:hypothetical protein N5C43_19760 [Comamonas terrigena]|uniref:hypothetical protein n=1 Tax=Comamonas terrigena TaxID=32013 RepID=UPI0024494329|nr:hypothetical protein [Comamonas terrigena]MDH1293488.1 hypothetical protein [Comamonas terrigena]
MRNTGLQLAVRLLDALQIYEYFTGSACAWAVLLLMANGCGMCRFLMNVHSSRSTGICIHKKAQENTHTVFPRPLQVLQRRNLRQALQVLAASRKS